MNIQIFQHIPSVIVAAVKKHNGIIAGGYIRDILIGENPPKDLDVFFTNITDWKNFNNTLKSNDEAKRVVLKASGGKHLNIQKWVVKDITIDSINYIFVQRPEHIVDTFDFTINMLWYNFEKNKICGPTFRQLDKVLEDLRLKKLVVGPSLWYRATFNRAVRRLKRFLDDGYTINQSNFTEYKKYINYILKASNIKERTL